MELNKILAAVLVAGIVASLSGFIAREVIHPHELHEDAVAVEAAEGGAAGGGAKISLPEPVLELIAAADIARGQGISKACTACHSFDKGGPNGTGPNLWGVVNRDKGGVAGFEYSAPLAAHEGSWTYASLNHFLWKPKNYVPGTKMNYIGLKKPEDRAALIAWLRTLSDAPAALPSAGEIEAEKLAFAPPAPEVAAEAIEGAEGAAKEALEGAVKDAAKDVAKTPLAAH